MTVMATARESLWRELRRAPGQCTELRGDSTIDVRARVPECSASNEMKRDYSRVIESGGRGPWMG